MSHRSILKFLATALVAVVVVVILPVYGAKREQVLRQSSAPTRTPTVTPTVESSASPAPSTATPEPTLTSTASPTRDLALTPDGGYMPTAAPCATPPTVQALGNVNVRLGPGLDYDVISRLVFLEVRPIVGRAAFSAWWLIQLSEGMQGWVADDALTVQGYIGSVPIAEVADQNVATPTPGPEWNPTPDPSCTPMPTVTPTAIEASTSTPKLTNTASPTQKPSPSVTGSPTPTETPAPSATQTVIPTDTATSTVPASLMATPRTASDDASDGSMTWILFIGVGLVLVGLASFVLRRRGA